MAERHEPKAEGHRRERPADRLRVLAEASRAFAEAVPNYETLLRVVAERISEATGDACTVRLLSEDGRWLRPVAGHHPDPDLKAAIWEVMSETAQSSDAGVWKPVIEEGRTVRLTVSPQEMPPDASAAQAEFLGCHPMTSIMGAPMAVRGRTIGGLSLVRYGGGSPHEPEDEMFMRDLAERAALAIDNARLYRAAREEVAERKQAEEGLRESEERFRATFEQAAVGIAHVAPDGSWLRVNDRLCEITGYPREELLEKTFQDITHPDDLDADLEQARQLLAGEIRTYSMEKRYVRKDGSVVWTNLTGSLVREPSGEPSYFIAVVEDIAERKRAGEGERRSRDELEAILGGIADGVTAQDPSGRVVYANEVAARIAGYPSAGAMLEPSLPERMELFEVADELGRPFPPERLPSQRALRGEEGAEEVMRFRAQGTGEERWTVVKATPIFDEEGYVVLAVNVFTDITERKQAEEAMRNVREVERERMARDLHDEVVQDLTYALATLQVAQEGPENAAFHARLEGAVDALKRAGQGLRGAIYDLRLEGATKEGLVELLGPLVELNRSRWPESSIALSVGANLTPSLPESTEAEVVRMVGEALTNARRHSGARNVRVALEVDDGVLRVEVEDDGEGFDPAVASGTGLKGMRERAQALGGSLRVESEAGMGTKILFELDLQGQGTAEGDKAARVLIVEDHASFREAIASIFQRDPEFALVAQAGSIAEARGMLDGVDVAIVDLELPDGFGGTLIKELHSKSPQAQALVLSASLGRAQVARAVESGAAAVLHKSVGMENVLQALRRLRRGETVMPLEEVVELLRFASARKDREYEAQGAIARLTPRERAVLEALAEGLDSKEIAERLHISVKTEANHMTSILRKLGVHSRLQALVFAARHGVVEIK